MINYVLTILCINESEREKRVRDRGKLTHSLTTYTHSPRQASETTTSEVFSLSRGPQSLLMTCRTGSREGSVFGGGSSDIRRALPWAWS